MPLNFRASLPLAEIKPDCAQRTLTISQMDELNYEPHERILANHFSMLES